MSQQSSVPNFVRGLIRRLGLHGEADKVKYHLTRLRRRRANAAYLQAHPDVAFPPPYMLYEAFNLDYEKYFEDGRDTAATFAEYVRPVLDRSGSRFLDWGCGPARLLRHMPDLLPAGCALYGADANAETISWCRESLPGIEFEVCGVLPPLSHADGAIDAALGLSVLTHLSLAAHEAWLTEFARVLRPGGRLVLTTHGDIFRERLDGPTARRYDRGELIAAAYGPEGHRLYAAYHPPRAFRAAVAGAFEVVEHVPGRRVDWGVQQDVWVLRKRDRH